MPPRNIDAKRVRWFLHNGARTQFLGLTVRFRKKLYVAVWPYPQEPYASQHTVTGNPTIVYRFSHVRRPSTQSMVRIAERLVRDGLMKKVGHYKPGVSYAGGPSSIVY